MVDPYEHELSLHDRSRRRFLAAGVGAAASLLIAPTVEAKPARSLSLYHTHTGERLQLTFAEHGRHIPGALAEISRFLRDFRTGEVHPIDPRLLDTLSRLREKAGATASYEIISGYRSPQTNEMLGARSNGVAKRSLHMDGRAIDVRLPGVPTDRLRDMAIDLKAGGVGYYGRSDFVHLDTGRVRSW